MRRPLFFGLLVLASLFSAAAPSGAMTLRDVEMTCPYDGTKFTFRAQGSGTSFDKTLDLMSVGPIRSPWPIAVCPTNGFVFIRSNYTTEDFERLKPIVLSAEYQATKDETPYYRAAWITERDGGAHSKVSWLLLQASWEAGREELRERYETRPAGSPDIGFKEFMKQQGTQGERYRRYATELLARLPADIAAAEKPETYKVLTGELLRRLGRFDEAETFLKDYAATLDPASRLAKVVAFERDLIARKDIGIHLFSELPKSK
jgi:hypothetical protein